MFKVKPYIWTLISHYSHSIVPLEWRWFVVVSEVFSCSIFVGSALLPSASKGRVL